jgi:hypothetical protein
VSFPSVVVTAYIPVNPASLPLPCRAVPSLLPVLSNLQPAEIYVDDESKLTLHGLVQHYVMLHEEEKNRKLTDLLDALDFNQVGTAHCCQ